MSGYFDLLPPNFPREARTLDLPKPRRLQGGTRAQAGDHSAGTSREAVAKRNKSPGVPAPPAPPTTIEEEVPLDDRHAEALRAWSRAR